MKKHLHNSLRALFLSLAVLLSLPMLAVEVEIDGINYEFDADTKRAAVIAKSGGEYYSGSIIIPESVEHERTAYSVTRIAPQAFFICPDLTSVTIPNSVESIGQTAFAGCTALTSVTIGNSVRSIGNLAFTGCTELLNVYCYAENVPSTARDAFEGLDLEFAILHVPAGSVDSYKTAPWSSFRTIVAISTEVEINGINYDLNGDATQATVVSKSDKYSGEVIIPESVEHEGTAYSVTSIGKEAFKFCSGLTSVTIGNSVTSIGYQAFLGCSGLTSVTIPNSVESIEPKAFYNCYGLTSVTIGNSVTSIGYQAFCYCSGLASVTIPNSVTSIGDAAFALCSDLTSVTIGNGVESIGQLAFSKCPKLHDVYCYAVEVPSTESNAFDDSYTENPTLHVPAGSVGRYTETAPWSGFGKIVGLSKEYSLTVSSVGYATLYLDFNAEIPEDVKAYVAKEVVDNRLKMERVEGVLPANTGVIIRAEEGTYTFVESNETPAEIGENLLVGSVVNTMITAEDNTSYYILAATDDNVGMYPVELVDGAFVCKANKAYLPISSAHARIYFDFGTETGILETENGNVKTENCYDLSGRRVQNAQKGIFIVNGKKVVK